MSYFDTISRRGRRAARKVSREVGELAHDVGEIEARRNRHMHAQFRKVGKVEEDRSFRTKGGKVWDPDLGRERKRIKPKRDQMARVLDPALAHALLAKKSSKYARYPR